jgi:hypothetical protein
MDIPHRAKQGSSRPNIFIHETSDHSRAWGRSDSYNSNSSPTSSSIPVSIPGAKNEPPPPLPPPRHLENPNLAWELQNKPDRGFEWDNRSIPTSSSLYGNSMSGLRRSSAYTTGESDEQNEPRPRERRESSISTLTGGTREGSYPKFEEGYNSFSSLSSIPSQLVMNVPLCLAYKIFNHQYYEESHSVLSRYCRKSTSSKLVN